MKRIVKLSFAFVISSTVVLSCTKAEEVITPIPQTTLDTTLFTDGNWIDYPTPMFTTSTNTNRNLLLENYAGHKCPNCPTAASLAENIELDHPSRVFTATIHSGPGLTTGFQDINEDCGTVSNPDDQFCHDFITNEGLAYGEMFQNYGFVGNPYGNISRFTFSDFMFQYHTTWVEKTNELLLANDLKVNIQAENNFYDASNGGYLHIQSQFLEDLSSDFNIVTYAIQNELVEWQDSLGVDVEDYHHHNVFLGCVDGEAWGASVASSPQNGEVVETAYSFVLPAGLTKEEVHFLTYIYDVSTYEVLQVIKHEFN